LSPKDKRPSEIQEIPAKILLTKGTARGELCRESIVGKKEVVEKSRAGRVEPTTKKMTIHDIVVATLKGEKPDRLPFIDRIEMWVKTHTSSGTLPEEFRGMSLREVHEAVGIGQEKFINAFSFRLRGVEVISRFEGEAFYHEKDPVLDNFPNVWDLVPDNRAGTTDTEFVTPVGRVSVQHRTLPGMLAAGMEPYLRGHLIKEESDYRTVKYILERAEYIPQYERFQREEKRIGDIGFLVPFLPRIPFQQMLLEYLGELALFNALYDCQELLTKLLTLLDGQLVEILHKLSEWPVLYTEFGDNLHAEMTNPKLFGEYCLPYYQRYAEILHGQDKKVGSHTDGELQPLLDLLAESGLDVCESFSPAPLTECTFEEAWEAWQDGPIIWGGIPSPILEERTSEGEFQEYVERVLEIIDGRPIILGIGDMVMGNNLIERVRYIASRVENHSLDG
jgi:hypothetical protein